MLKCAPRGISIWNCGLINTGIPIIKIGWSHDHLILVMAIIYLEIWADFLSLAQSKLRLCSANHRPGYWSNLPCDWPSIAWAYSEQETENRPWSLYWNGSPDSTVLRMDLLCCLELFCPSQIPSSHWLVLAGPTHMLETLDSQWTIPWGEFLLGDITLFWMI